MPFKGKSKENFFGSFCIGSVGINCGKNEKVSKLTVTNELSSAITNSNTVINEVVNSTISKVSTEMVQKNGSDIQIDVNATNQISLGDISVTDGSEFDISQRVKNDTTALAISDIVSKQASLTEMTQSLMNDLQNKASNDTKLNAALDQMVQIAEIKKNAGGPEGMVSKVTDAFNSFLDSPKSERDEQTYNNKIGVSISNSNYSKNDLKNYLENSISQKLTVDNLAKCRLSTASGNVLEARNVVLKNGSKVAINQDATLNAFQQCIMKMDIGNDLTNKLLQTSDFKSMVENLNKNAAELQASQDAKNTKENTQDSAIMKSVDNAVNKAADVLNNLNPLNALKDIGKYIAIAVIALVVGLIGLFVVFPMISKMFGKKGVNTNMPNAVSASGSVASATKGSFGKNSFGRPVTANPQELAKSLKYLFN